MTGRFALTLVETPFFQLFLGTYYVENELRRAFTSPAHLAGRYSDIFPQSVE